MKTIDLWKKNVKVGEALVSDEEYDRVSLYKWWTNKAGYAETGQRAARIYLHRLIVGCVPGDGKIVDHINGNKLDNCRENLRIVTKKQNCENRTKLDSTNTSGFRGVTWSKLHNKWRSQVHSFGKNYYYGLFFTPEEANQAAITKRKELKFLTNTKEVNEF